MEPSSGSILYNNPFNAGQREYIRSLLQKYGLSPLVYSFQKGRELVSWERGRETEGMLRYLARRRGDARLHPVDSESALYEGDIFYFTCIDEKARARRLTAVGADKSGFEDDLRAGNLPHRLVVRDHARRYV